jgi:sugar/nucleoside kinase (ribokinase family)
LIIGHVTKDLLPDGSFSIGGTATYAARTALAMGCRVGVVTSAAEDLKLDGVLSGCDVVRVPAEATTTFENIYLPSGREQFLHAVADPLGLEAVPGRWRRPDIVHLGPLVGECDPELAGAFPGALVGSTLQGWMRTWNNSRRVYVGSWEDAADLLPRIDASVISRDDVGGDEAMIVRFAQLAPILAVTLGPKGCQVYADGAERHIPVTAIEELDPTGAGDIFAAAFFVSLCQTGDPWAAANLANRIAALSVRRGGWKGTPTAEEVAGVMRAE